MSDDSSKENISQEQQTLSVSYVRARCDSPQEEELVLLAQQRRINVYAKQHNLLFVQSFVDRRCGAGTGPELTQMYNFLAQHREVRCVVVDTTDRLARNLSDVSRVHGLDRELHIAGSSMISEPTVAMIRYLNALLFCGQCGIALDPEQHATGKYSLDQLTSRARRCKAPPLRQSDVNGGNAKS